MVSLSPIEAGRKLRGELIRPNLLKLQGFGVMLKRSITSGARGGRPGTAYLLNEEQALLVVSLSRTEAGRKLRGELSGSAR